MSGGGNISDKDPGIKLFGMKIPLPEYQIPLPEYQIPVSSQMGCQIPPNSATLNACCSPKNTEGDIPCAENTEQRDESSNLRDSKQDSQHNAQGNESKASPKPAEDNKEIGSIDQEKTFKKPDKILHCPRCNSLDTKFCYFNNYNVNQPRHFCKNCQRYWTAGGTMRNVPVGAGRRKNKHLATQYRHIIVSSDGVPANRLETKDSSSHQLVSTLESAAAFRSSSDNGTVLKFGPDTPLCESMDSMLNLREQKRNIDASAINSAENGEEEPSLCGSSVTNVSTQGAELSEHNISKPLPCYPVPPWGFPWNPNWNNVAPMAAVPQSPVRMCNSYSTDPAAMPWCPVPMMAVPTICPPNMPLQFVPAPYWGGTPMWASGPGAASIGSNGCLSPSSSTSNSCCSGNGSPTLGKHTRDTVFTDEEKSDKSVLAPKTLRIDDPNEASKSPLWATLGIKHDDKHQSVAEDAIVKTLETKGEGSDRVSGMSQILEANPAAISRAHAFQESM